VVRGRGGEGELPDAKDVVAIETPAKETLPSRGRRRRSAASGGALPLDSASRERRGGLPGVHRPGTIPRGNWAHPGRKTPSNGLPKAPCGLRVGESRGAAGAGKLPGSRRGIVLPN